jgi:hypothetical protein
MAGTLVGYTGHDPAPVILIRAADAVSQQQAEVAATVTGQGLTLSAAGYQVSCLQAGTLDVEPPGTCRRRPCPR